jgi:EAL domain-containing protein (putative c-di-GMP-specific phosphodiesterase class I)
MSAPSEQRVEALLILISSIQIQGLAADHSQALQSAGHKAVHEALLAAGIAERAISPCEDLFVIALGNTGKQFPRLNQVNQLMLRLHAGITGRPVEAEAGRAYLRVEMDLLFQSTDDLPIDVQELFRAEVPRPAGDAVNNYLRRREHALQSDIGLCNTLLDDLSRGRLLLAFQPVRLLENQGIGECLYSEALLRRIPGASEGAGSLADAIAALERMNLVSRLDCSVIWTTLQLLAQYPDQKLGCNVSARSLDDSAWWRLLLTYLDDHRDIARRFTIEVTETSHVACSESALALIARLQACGVRLALDDIGAGHSTLEFLAQARADVVKIDRSVLLRSRDLRHSPEILRNLARVCSDYSPCVVVEGIEGPTELSAARYAAASGVQGFFVDKPSISPAWLTRGPARVSDIYSGEQADSALVALSPLPISQLLSEQSTPSSLVLATREMA